MWVLLDLAVILRARKWPGGLWHCPAASAVTVTTSLAFQSHPVLVSLISLSYDLLPVVGDGFAGLVDVLFLSFQHSKTRHEQGLCCSDCVLIDQAPDRIMDSQR